ncbi:hypothetical protein AAFC00_003645 [Neodothiora populina]|uniref:Uncharacterized protein n=1 Tax=Neodothiora populina TaxID=2781224 RepID=A0ABR3PEW3_9PEZI
MTKMHQHDDLITYVQERAIGWLDERPDIWVDLNTGFGPSFRWLLHEYEPAWPELLYREQQELCADGLTWRLTKKRSPPLGVKKLDKGDDKRLKDYISTLVSYHLNDFEKACFDGEDPFKIKVTGLLCTLYRRLRYDSQHGALRDALTSIFKMLAATLIMDHTIDIDDAGRDQTLTRLSGHNDPAAYSQRVSPWMASMQLKYYFARIRHDHYNDILGRLQQILHNPVKMYPRICALILILALGLVLEECQQLLLFQAEGRLSRGEEKDEWVARNKARQQCAEIDGAFSHIKNIFHCRYATGRNTQQADIRTWLNSSKDPWEKGFLRSLIDLCDEHRDHLKNRESLDLGSASNDNHSSRLLARFLLSVT